MVLYAVCIIINTSVNLYRESFNEKMLNGFELKLDKSVCWADGNIIKHCQDQAY
jgi:hypothetical protein